MSYFVLPTLLFTIATYVSNNMLHVIIPVEKERAGFLLSITRILVVSVRWSFLFLWVLRMGCAI